MSAMVGPKKKGLLLKFLIGLFILIVATVITIGILLKNGLAVKNLSVGGIVISDCSLIWNDKLELEVGSVDVKQQEHQAQDKSSAETMGKVVRTATHLLNIFAKLEIKNIEFNGQQFALNLVQEGSSPHILTIDSDDIALSSSLIAKDGVFEAIINEIHVVPINSKLKGDFVIDGEGGFISGALSALLNGSFPVDLDFKIDQQQLSFSGSEAGEIIEINSLVDLFGLGPNIQRWITDYLKGSRYHLKSFKGTIPWDNPKAILSTLEAEVRVDDTEYTFAQGIDPVKAPYTEVYFKNGVLNVKPHNAKLSGQNLGSSTVDIDFNDPQNILLTVDILTNAVANTDIVNLLDHYHIPLPFLQTGGDTATDFRLSIILNKQQVESRGIFEIEKGTIEWGGKQYHISDVKVKQVNADIQIEKLTLRYEDLLQAKISGGLHPKKRIGDLDIELEELNIKLGKSVLKTGSSGPAKLHYHFDSEGHTLEAKPTTWRIDAFEIMLGAFKAPVVIDDLSMTLPPVRLETQTGNVANVSGTFSIKQKQADFNFDLLKCKIKDLELMSSNVTIEIQYDQEIIISTGEKSDWELNQMPIVLYPAEFKYGNSLFTISNSRISYGNLFDSVLVGKYDLKTKTGLFSLDKIDVTNKNLEKELSLSSTADFELRGDGGKFAIIFPTFDLEISTDINKSWSAEFRDLSKLYNRSPLLRKYGVRAGKLTVSSVNGKRPFVVKADIKSPYPILVEGDSQVEQLQIKSKITDQGIFITANDKVDVEINDESIDVKSSDIGFNLPGIMTFLQERSKTSSSEEKVKLAVAKETKNSVPRPVTLAAKDSQLYLSPNSRILADNINVKFVDGKLTMDLHHGPGYLDLDLTGDQFLLHGKNLNDRFMGALIQQSDFQGGSLSMVAQGSFKEFSFVLNIEETVLGNLATLNNIMAFLNTAPALMTFSVPEYSQQGMKIHEAVVGMKFKEKMAKFESFHVDSPGLQGKAAGWIDFGQKKLDMDVQIKTQAARNFAKVPIVGYVVAGDDDDASLTLKIDGDLDNPTVKDSLLKDIIVYPFELLFRTLKLPFHMVGEMQKGKSMKQIETNVEPDEVEKDR